MADNNKILLVVIIIAAVLGYLYFSGYFQQGGMYGGAPGIAPYTGGGYSGGAPATTSAKKGTGLPIDTILYAIIALILIALLMKFLPNMIRNLGRRQPPRQGAGAYGMGQEGGGRAEPAAQEEKLSLTVYRIAGNAREPLATSEKRIDSEHLRKKLKTENKLVATAKKGDSLEIEITLTDAAGNPLREEYKIRLRDKTKDKDLQEKDLTNMEGRWVYKTTSSGSDMYQISATHKGTEHHKLLHITSEPVAKEDEQKLNLVATPFRIVENRREQLTTKEEQIGSEHLKKTLKLEKKSVATAKEGDKLEIEISLSDSKGNVLKEDYKITIKTRNKTEKLSPDKEGHAIYKTDALNRLYQITATHKGKEYRALLQITTEPAAVKTKDTSGKYEIRAENTTCEAGKSCKFYVQILDAKKKNTVKIKKITFQPSEGSKNIRAEKIEFQDNNSGQRAENELQKVQEGANKIKIKATLENGDAIEGEVTITGVTGKAQKKKGSGWMADLLKDPIQKAEERANKAEAGINTAEKAGIGLKKEKATLTEARKALEGAKSAKEKKDKTSSDYLKDAEAKIAAVEAALKKLEQMIEVEPIHENTHYKGRHYVRSGVAPIYMVSLKHGDEAWIIPPTHVKAYDGNKELAKTDNGNLTTPAQTKGRKEYTFEVEGIGKKKIEVEWLTLKDAVAKGITSLKFTIKESSNKKLSEYAGRRGARVTLVAEATGSTDALREMEYLYMLRIKEGDSVRSANMKDPAEYHTSIDGTKKYTAELIDAEEGGSKTDDNALKETINNIRSGGKGGLVCSSKTITIKNEESAKGTRKKAPAYDTSGKYEIRAEHKSCEAGKDCKFDVEVRDAQTKKDAKVKKITFTPAEGSKKIRHKTIPSGLDALRGAYEGLIENELRDVQEGPNRIEITATLTDGTLVAGETRITGTKAKETKRPGGALKGDVTLELEVEGKPNPENIVTTADEVNVWIYVYKNGRLHEEETDVKVWATSGVLGSVLPPTKKTIKVKELHQLHYKPQEGTSTLHVQAGKQERSIKITRTKSEEKKKEDAKKVKEKSTDKQKREEKGITFDLELEGTADRKASTITTSADEIYVKITVKKDGEPHEQSRDRPPIKAKTWVKTSRFSLKTNGQEFELNRDEPTYYKQVLKNRGRSELFVQIGKQVKSIKITRT